VTRTRLRGAAGAAGARRALRPIWLGTAGWANPPEQRQARPDTASHLQHYARCFNAVEINSSFYRPHRLETYQRWAAATGPAFRFSVKIPKAISHDAAMRVVPAELDAFIGAVSGLGAKLGVLLLQLPGQLDWQPRIARRFFARLRDRIDVPIVCEPRHPSWSSPSAQRAFADFGITLVSADPVRVPEHRRHAGPVRYHRLHGSPRVYWSSYSASELQGLAERLNEERSAGGVWCIFDNTAAGAAWTDAQLLRATLRTARAG
jgi:uncharacterized protein YecE (DUF72 family)